MSDSERGKDRDAVPIESTSGDESVREERLMNALQEVRDALDAGSAVDRSSLLSKYPEVASELVSCLDNLEFISQVAPQLADSNWSKGSEGLNPLTPLGDFRIVREIGRGGMGVVYEAEQLSLGRMVALKVLPFAAMLDDKQIQRFKNEARAAATLTHPNIVPVLFVGSERGVHFYAMHLIEGRNLAGVIRDLRETEGRVSSGQESPSCSASTTGDSAHAAISTERSLNRSKFYRRVASMGVQAAQALFHAHENGVVHRDIKPANLMLAPDGKLWVTDFGLARIERDLGLTMTGDMIGTIRYMAPELTLAKRRIVDQRADIYSLGVTLYELLTLEPAFSENDRHALLREIASKEPLVLRKREKAIPRELEIIVSKAIEKNPEDRYMSAFDLAEDLQRFLDCRPIFAHAATFSERARKWSRRNATFLLFSLIGMLVLATVLSLTMWTVNAAYRRERIAFQALQRQRNSAAYNSYVSDLLLCQQDWKEGRLGRFRQLLSRHIPAGDSPDFRGWEWYYLRGLPNSTHQTLSHPNGRIVQIRCSKDNRFIASCCPDVGLVRVWDLMENSNVKSLVGDSDGIWSCDWSPNGKYLAAGDFGGRVFVWHFPSGTRAAVIDAHEAFITAVRWSPNGKLLATGSVHDQTLKIWNTESWSGISTIDNGDSVWSLAWNPDGSQIASGGWSSGMISIWNWELASVVRKVNAHETAIYDLEWSSNGDRLCSASYDETIGIWKASDLSKVSRLIDHKGRVNGISWDPDSEYIASAGTDAIVRIWRVDQEKVVNELRGHSDGCTDVEWSQDGNYIASCGILDATVRVWDPFEAQTSKSLPGTFNVAWSPDGQFIATKGHGAALDDLVVFDVATNEQIALVPDVCKGRRNVITWRPLGGQIAVVSFDGSSIYLVDVATWQSKKAVTQPNIYTAAYSHDGKRLATADGDRSARRFQVTIWDSDNLDVLTRFTRDSDVMGSVAWSPDDSKLAAADWAHGVDVWDVRQAKHMYHRDRHSTFSGNEDGQYSIAFSPDGEYLAAGSREGMIVVWDAATGDELKRWQAHAADVLCVDWHPAAARIATGSEDGSVRIWNTSTNDELMRLDLNEGNVRSIAWSPDGSKMAAATESSVRVWKAFPDRERR